MKIIQRKYCFRLSKNEHLLIVMESEACRIRDRPFNLQGEGCYGFLFHSEFSDNTRVRIFFLSRKARIFFPKYNIRLFFFLHQNQNLFLEKKHNPPPQVKWSFPKVCFPNIFQRIFIKYMTDFLFLQYLHGSRAT